ncbi:MAG TPA: serine hydrolase domain-containing protein, partial [Pirellulales bacterium]|nr:serine hydrolase domain-containing protein [Pirellulales bacterium]
PVRQRIAKALVDHNLPSISVAVAREGKIAWEQGFGWADRENRIPASEHTLYSIASTSKPITATGLMVLVERKLVDLDRPANDYLGEAKLRARVGDAADATLRRVANHTSGLPLHYQFFYADEPYHPPTRDETIRRFGNLVTAPGERYQYSNLGFGVLDYVIAHTSKKSFADFMREEVFLPLGMTHTSIGIGPGLEPHQAIRYTPDGTRIPFYEFDHDGASAVYSSAHDLARFAMFHMKEHLADQKAILSDAGIDTMQAPTSHPSGGRGYGIGWSIGQSRGYQTVDHDGGMPGVSTMCMFLPAERIAVVVLANSNSSLPLTINDMILKILLPEPKPKTQSPTAESRFNPPPDRFEPGSQLVGRWKGRLATYQGELPLVLDIKDSGDVHVRLDKQLETLLNNPSFHEGFLHGRFAGDIGTDDARGRRYHLHLDVKLRDQALNGPVTAITLPDGRGTSAVTHWLELKREAASSATPGSTSAPAGP